MSAYPPPLNILIVGCSIAGPTLATFLLLSPLPASQKPHITILERAPALRPHGQNIDVRGAGVTILRKLGLLDAVRAATTGEAGVQFVDAADRVWAAFPAGRSSGEEEETAAASAAASPTSEFEILRGRFAQLCWRRSEQASERVRREGGRGIEFVFGDRLDELEQRGDNKVHVRFAQSGVRRAFDVVVGADGLQSLTRQMAWGCEGEGERVKRLGMYGGFFSMPRVGATDTAWRRWYHAPGRRGIMLRPDGTGERTTVFMAVVKDDDDGDARLDAAATSGRGGVQVQKELLREYFADAGWESERVVREMLATDDFYYDAIAQVKMESWSKGRVVLVGDAGYCASPISGMGTTLALSGAYNLAGALLRHPSDPGAAFAVYEDAMRPTVDRAQKLAPGMPHLLHPQTAWGVWMLNAIMFVLYRSGLLPLLARFAGPPAHSVPVPDYGFEEFSEEAL
ncbi:hypothetical protein JDV02_002166 [Purpureocillium takamizusanense]|uniref:FAD-binding domain-containing protein n=1 Tax=Purpureocillium takamizusanense TaxID=2060973 RepID=A0A9Q8Q9S3_9HYPO|nr:uncharacterized protein JDV02_002166 [Purpureocillium takamizusanense]UNI15655.1 hypothetical protein JDV02_002166 [Purpureocillium takamizusanense]